jgi:hypothetical protein
MADIVPISSSRILTAAAFQGLTSMPPVVEWFANLGNAATRRATRRRSRTSFASPASSGGRIQDRDAGARHRLARRTRRLRVIGDDHLAPAVGAGVVVRLLVRPERRHPQSYTLKAKRDPGNAALSRAVPGRAVQAEGQRLSPGAARCAASESVRQEWQDRYLPLHPAANGLIADYLEASAAIAPWRQPPLPPSPQQPRPEIYPDDYA